MTHSQPEKGLREISKDKVFRGMQEGMVQAKCLCERGMDIFRNNSLNYFNTEKYSKSWNNQCKTSGEVYIDCLVAVWISLNFKEI